MKKIISFIMLVLLLSACSTDADNSEQKIIYSSFFIINDMAKTIGGDRFAYKIFMPDNADAHSFEPTAKNIADASNAELFLYCSPELETWINKIMRILPDMKYLVLSDNVELIKEDEEEQTNVDDHEIDPHIWLSPKNAAVMYTAIADKMTEISPEDSQIFADNLNNILVRLNKLEEDFIDLVSKMKTPEIIVEHMAYGYLCKEYGIRQYAMNQNLHDNEITPKALSALENYIREKSIKYIYLESDAKSDIVNLLEKECGVKSLTLYTMEKTPSFVDINNTDVYIQLMNKNLEALYAGLGIPDVPQ